MSLALVPRPHSPDPRPVIIYLFADGSLFIVHAPNHLSGHVALLAHIIAITCCSSFPGPPDPHPSHSTSPTSSAQVGLGLAAENRRQFIYAAALSHRHLKIFMREEDIVAWIEGH